VTVVRRHRSPPQDARKWIDRGSDDRRVLVRRVTRHTSEPRQRIRRSRAAPDLRAPEAV
jgi:hypothetical protein